MKKILSLVGLFAAMTAIADAGEIRGVLTKNKAPSAGQTIEITVGKHVYTTATDRHGFYRVIVPQTGRCNLKVVMDPQHSSTALIVYSFDHLVLCDLVLTVDPAKNIYTLTQKVAQ
jgi:hypothetical protein